MRFETQYEQVHTSKNGTRWIDLKSGRSVKFSDAQREAEDNWSSVIRWLSRMTKLTHDGNATPSEMFDAEDLRDLAQYDWDRIDSFLDHLEATLDHYRKEVGKHNVRRTKQERIAQLRNTKGRSPEEAALYNAKADALERDI